MKGLWFVVLQVLSALSVIVLTVVLSHTGVRKLTSHSVSRTFLSWNVESGSRASSTRQGSASRAALSERSPVAIPITAIPGRQSSRPQKAPRSTTFRQLQVPAPVSPVSVQKRFKERRSLVRSACQKAGLWKKPLTPTQRKIVYYNMIVDDKHQLLYCYLPKAACTSWKTVVQVLTGKAKSTAEISGRDAHRRSRLKFLQQFKNPVDVQKRLANYRKLMVHREPMTRFISAYNSKFVTADPYFVKKFGTQIIKQYRKDATNESLQTGKGVRFQEFARYVSDAAHKALLFDGHWRPAVSQCQPCFFDYDWYSSTDTADEDAAAVLGVIGANGTVSFPHANFQHHSTDVRDYYSKLPRSVVEKLIAIYRMDFTLFGYKKPGVHDLVY